MKMKSMAVMKVRSFSPRPHRLWLLFPVIFPVDYKDAGEIIDDVNSKTSDLSFSYSPPVQEMHLIMVKPLPSGCRLTVSTFWIIKTPIHLNPGSVRCESENSQSLYVNRLSWSCSVVTLELLWVCMSTGVEDCTYPPALDLPYIVSARQCFLHFPRADWRA